MLIDSINNDDCKEGDIIANDIINENGIILVQKETILNEYIINKLTALKFNHFPIYRFNNEQDNIEADMSDYKQTKFILDELASGKKLDYQNITYLSETIYQSIKVNESIAMYLKMLRSVDEYTYTHSLNTAFYSMMIGKWLDLSEVVIEQLIQSGLLHDIGKSQISTEILNKKGTLTNEEYEIIKKHTIYGFEMLKDVSDISSEVKNAILYHHERMDGSGYPFHVTSKRLNILEKVLAIADVYDAMTSDRVYKKRFTPFDTFEMFLTNGLRSYDIDILNIFIRKMANNYIGSKVALSNGKLGKIVYIPPYDICNPIVLADTNYLDLSREKELNIISFL